MLISLDIHVHPDDAKNFDNTKLNQYILNIIAGTVKIRRFANAVLIDGSVNAGEITTKSVDPVTANVATENSIETALSRFERTEPDMIAEYQLKAEVPTKVTETPENSEILPVGTVGDGKGTDSQA